MLLGWILQTLVTEFLQGADDTETGVARFNDIVNVTLVCSIVWVAEEVFVLLLLLSYDSGLSFWSLGSLEFLAIEYLDGTA